MGIKRWSGAAADNAWGTAGNWVEAAVPVAGDDVIIPALAADSTKDIAGSDQDGIALNSFDVLDGCELNIGSASAFLQLDLADDKTCNLAGSGAIYLDLTGLNAAVNITAAGPGEGTGTYGLNLVAGETGQSVAVSCASTAEKVSLAANAGETGVFPTVKVNGGTVKIGGGVSMTGLTVAGGVVYNEADATTIVQHDGTLYHDDDATAGTLKVWGGTCYYRSIGTCTAGFLAASGTIDCSKDARARTFTNMDIYGGLLKDPYQTITFTNPPTLNGCGLDTIERGKDMNVAFSAAS